MLTWIVKLLLEEVPEMLSYHESDSSKKPVLRALLTPALVRVCIIIAIRNYFRGHPDYPFNDDDAKSEIFVQGDLTENAKYEDIIPAVIVEGNGTNFVEDSVGNVSGVADVNRYLLKTEKQYTIGTSITLSVICQSQVESENLAFELSLFLCSLKQYKGNTLNLQGLTVPSIGKTFMVNKEGFQGTFCTPIQVQATFARKINNVQLDEGPLLRDVIMYMAESEKTKKINEQLDKNQVIANIPPGTPNYQPIQELATSFGEPSTDVDISPDVYANKVSDVSPYGALEYPSMTISTGDESTP